jgi:hypothetical protein
VWLKSIAVTALEPYVCPSVNSLRTVVNFVMKKFKIKQKRFGVEPFNQLQKSTAKNECLVSLCSMAGKFVIKTLFLGYQLLILMVQEFWCGCDVDVMWICLFV